MRQALMGIYTEGIDIAINKTVIIMIIIISDKDIIDIVIEA
jgi:hypothetical protein